MYNRSEILENINIVYKMFYHIILDDGNLLKSIDDNEAFIHKSVGTLEELIKELNTYWFNYEIPLSTEEEAMLSKLSRELRKTSLFKSLNSQYMDLWTKKYKTEKELIPMKISYIEDIRRLVSDINNKNKLLSCNRLTVCYECCHVNIYVNDDPNRVTLTSEDWKIMFPPIC